MSNVKSEASNVVIKICGVTRLEDALMCAEAGADIIGLNFYPKSPRYVQRDKARRIVEALGQGTGRPLIIGLFVNADVFEMANLFDAIGLDAAQFSGDETPDLQAALGRRSFKAICPRDAAEAASMASAFRAHAPEDDRLPTLIVDAYHPALYGGTGRQTSVDIALAAKRQVPRMMLAGGLTPENVAEQVRLIRPWGVDVASGVEKEPGIKDRKLVRAFIDAARSASG